MKEELLRKINDLDSLIKSTIVDKENKTVVVSDGIVDTDEYFGAKYRIACILKEPNDTKLNEHGVIGGWDMRGFISDGITEYSRWKSTYLPLVYSAWGILNDFCLYDDMDNYDDNTEMIDVLKKIAFINIKKLPGGSSSSNQSISQTYFEHKHIILKQLELYNPQIIIFGGTIHHFINDLEIPLDEIQEKGYYSTKERIYISNYHPNQRTIDQENYCNHIIKSAEEWALNIANI